ncbi:hypothetical protein QJS04_geneDACA001444 [Acorus gramineus]|uniref:Uncharacterized protein n=1 Tax=Acorus gramineus TaxID=55184 RepID=A0AAV9A6Z4_ACOGR|nr:hypothetical protein QJS04_geneDACA001444 [Acorus gramineus]
MKGFRLSSGRFSVQKLRVRWFNLISLLRRWRSCCDQALKSLKINIKHNQIFTSKRSRRRRGVRGGPRAERMCRRSNSFYAEAISDCLEFIKRSSISMDEIESQRE